MLRGAWAALLLALVGPRDLDVGVPPGSPLDFVRVPVESPRAERRPIPTPGAGPGRTVDETAFDRVPRRPLPLSRPLTQDFEGHLSWKPVTSQAAGTATGAAAMAGYPPAYPRDLYMHCASFFLMVMLHEDQVSPREILNYLVEIGEPAAYAATAVRAEESLRVYADYVLAAAGAVPSWAPRAPSKARIDEDLTRELVIAFPYEDRFGTEFLKLPGRVVLPTLTKLAEARGSHSLAARNAVFALRLYDDEPALQALRTLLKSADKVIRNRALAGLVRWQDREVVPWLIDQLDAADVPFRSYALHALGRIGDRRAVDPILKEARRQSGDWEFQWGALAALARLGGGGDEVAAFLARVPAQLNRMNLPEARRLILAERARIASALNGQPGELAWMRTVKAQEANRRLVEERLELERLQAELAKVPPAPPVAPKAPAPDPAPAVPPPSIAPLPSPAARLVAEARERLLEYTGVRSVKAEREAIILEVASEPDAVDARLLIGGDLGGFRVAVRVIP
jgi:hypothetical protein